MGNGRRIRRRLTPDSKPRPAPRSGFKGRHNVYACPHKHYTVTLDVDDGTTPVFLGCRHDGTSECGERALSAGYPDGPLPDDLAALFDAYGWEWYRPTERWARHQPPEVQEHLAAGGLALRRHQPDIGRSTPAVIIGGGAGGTDVDPAHRLANGT